MIHILDTDVFTLAELPDSREYLQLHARVLELSPEDTLVTTIVTYEEQTRGWLAYAHRDFPERPAPIHRHTRIVASNRLYRQPPIPAEA